MISFITWAQLHRDVVEFASRFRGQVDIVVGIPRSGALVASLLALHLNVRCATLDSNGVIVWDFGPRFNREIKTGGVKRILLVDDSALSGAAHAAVMKMKKAWPFLVDVKVGVLYASQKIADQWKGDASRSFLRVVPSPRIFAWNLFHCAQAGHVGLDFDGVICHDPTVPEDDEAGYVKAITNARPLYVPTWPVAAVVTHRLEKRREITHAWMKRHGVVARGGVEMYQANTCLERRARRDQDGTWKGLIYRVRDWRLFVESDPKQAARIRAISGKPVYCPAADVFWGGK